MLPTLDSSKRSVREIKSSLVMSLGEAIAEVVWSKLLEKGALEEETLTKFQTSFDDPGATNEKRVQIGQITAYAKEAAARVQAAAKAKPHQWTRLPEGISSATGEIDGKNLATLIDRETMRAMRRRPTRRAAVYDLFLDFFIDRGDSS